MRQRFILKKLQNLVPRTKNRDLNESMEARGSSLKQLFSAVSFGVLEENGVGAYRDLK